MSWLTVEADLHRNPAEYVRWDIDAQEGKPRVWMTRDEVALLLESAAQESESRLGLLCKVALVGAMRASEVSGLMRSDLDVESSTLTINRSVVHGVFNKPKTKGSRRIVTLPQELLEELRAHIVRQDKEEAKGRPLLFPTSVGTPQSPDTINYALARIRKRAGIAKNVTSHALRRTTNDLIRQAGGELVARAVTGHVTQEMTEHYSAVAGKERVAVLEKAFGNPPRAPSSTGATVVGRTEN